MRDSRITSNHLSRDAYLYIRQSTPRQVSENGESTRRQYALRERAVAAGWPAERIHIIDQDLGARAKLHVVQGARIRELEPGRVSSAEYSNEGNTSGQAKPFNNSRVC